MPNWCRNEVRFNTSDFTRAEATIESILDFLKETIPNFEKRLLLIQDKDKKYGTHRRWGHLYHRSIFDFNNLIPYPEKFAIRDEDSAKLSREDFIAKYGDDKDGYNSGGYEWCITNWGSKWDACDIAWVQQHRTLYFDTAWSPVFPIISELHKRFPEIHIEYEYSERGCAFIGGCEYIPESYWDPSDYMLSEVHSIEERLKRGEKVVPLKWQAGQAYNPWTTEYMGFKGG